MFFQSLTFFTSTARQRTRARRVRLHKRSPAGLRLEALESRQMLSITSLTAETITPFEGVAFTGTVAQFTGTPGDSFSASIDWGDGNKSAGSVGTVSAGNYTVSGTNTYAEDGLDNFSVVVTDTSDGSSLRDNTSAVVQENAFVLTAGASISTTEGVALTGVQVATFQDPGSPDTAADFDATIDWGDGTVTSGTVTGSGGNFAVTGDHTYTDELSGNYAVTVSEPDANFTFGPAISPVTVAEADSLTLNRVTGGTVREGQLLGGPAAVFNDSGYPSSDPADFSGTFDWGDGTIFTTGAGNVSITSDGAGHFTLSVSGHAYADEGDYIVVATLSDNAPGTATASATSTLTAAEADAFTPSATPLTITGTEGATLSGAVAAFTNTGYADNSASDFTAQIDWGDNTITSGTISGGSGAPLTVGGSHTYAEDGAYTITTIISDDAPGTAIATATGMANIAEADLAVSPAAALPAFTEGTTTSGVLATIADPNSTDPASSFSANIDWGDGTATAGTVTGSAGAYNVSGGHAYADEGAYTITVTAIENSAVPAATATTTFTASVAEGDHGNLIAATITPTEGQSFTGAVARFTDEGNPLQVAGDWTASIDWGDGTTTNAGTVTGPTGGPFTVDGNHTYADEGTFTILAIISDDPPSVLTNIPITSTAVVSDADTLTPPAAVTITATEGMTFSSSAIATFTNSYTGNVPGDFTANIDWGDGTLSAGTVTGSGGTLSVGGSHVYRDEMAATPISVVLADDAPGTASATATGTVTIEDAPLTAVGTSLTATAGVALIAAVASFRDANPNAALADFSSPTAATIDWGDGTTSFGTVIASGNTFDVIGNHTYATATTTEVKVHIADEGGSTTDVTSTVNATAIVDLTVTKTDNRGGSSAANTPGSVAAGTSLTYTIVVSNAGPSEAFGATITDNVPAGLRVLSTTPVVFGGAAITASSSSGGNISDTVNLPSGASIAYVVTGNVASSATGTLPNTVNVALAAGILNTGANSATDNDTITTAAGVTVIKTDNEGGDSRSGASGSVLAGTALAYTLVVSNAGPSDVAGATIADALPAGFTAATFTASATGGASGFTASGSGNISDKVNLPVGSTITYVVTGTVSTGASSALSNTANVTLPAGATNSGNLTATDTDHVTLPGYLAGVPGDGTAQTFLQNLYRELLGREPDAAGDAFWLSYLATNNSAAGRQAVIEAFLNSDEYKAHYITTLYQVFLGRVPEAGALGFWVGQMGQPGTAGLHNGPADESYILAEIVGSDEYYARAGGTLQGFVQALYHDLLGRPGEAAGVASWVALVNAQPQHRDVIVRLFLTSPELEHKLLNRFFPVPGGGAFDPLAAPGSPAAAGAYDLEVMTGNGWENLYLEGAALVASPGGGDAYFNELAAGASWDDVQLQMLASSQFYNNPVRPITG